jgi:hypothetical protein
MEDTLIATRPEATVAGQATETEPAHRAAIAPDVPPAAPRFDIYSPIHKGLRAFMASTLQAVGAMDAFDAEEVASTLGQVRELLAFCRGHLEHENTFVHAAMQARQPDSALVTAADHVEHEEAIDSLFALVSDVENASERARHAVAQQLYRQLSLFVVENFAHMHVEETDNNAVLWALYTDPEMIAIHDRLLASVKPAEMALAMKWMMPAVSHVERVGMLTGMRASVPAPVFDHMIGSIRPLLTERNWDKLAKALCL